MNVCDLIEPCYLIGEKQSIDCLETIFGRAKINNKGYFQITSRKKGNHKRMLHRLIVEHFYQIKLPKTWDIHHADGNKLNNKIANLRILPHHKHHRFHSENQIGNPLSEKTQLKLSNQKNSSGYFRVHKQKDETCKQGFIWHYRYYENGKRKTLQSVSLEKLEQKVLDKGLLWCEI